jgi:hypothetical protein
VADYRCVVQPHNQRDTLVVEKYCNHTSESTFQEGGSLEEARAPGEKPVLVRDYRGKPAHCDIWYSGLSNEKQTGEPDLARPFMNLAIIGVLKHRFLTGKKALHRLFPAEFKQNLPTAEGGQGPEVPPVMPALAATFVRSG